MKPRSTTWAAVCVLLLASACGSGMEMEPEHQELASGQHAGWNWILAGELDAAENEVCMELLVSPDGGSIHGGPSCQAVPNDDGANLSAGSSASSSAGPGEKEIANVRAVVGPEVADVRVTPEHASDGGTRLIGETVFIRQSSADLGWFVFLYSPQRSGPPAALVLLDEDGDELEQLELTHLDG